MRGRKPIPAEVHRANGDPGKRGRDEATLIGGRGTPDRPRGLPLEARKAWDTLVSDMEGSGVLDKADWPAVEACAVFVGRAREARKQLKADGAYIHEPILSKKGEPIYGPDGDVLVRVKPHPALKDERDAWNSARQLFDHLGIGPTGRARLGISKGAGKPMEREMSDRVGGSPRERRAELRAVQGGSA